MHTYIHTYIHTCIHTCIHTYIHTYIHTNIHTYIHTYIHTQMNTRRHIDTWTHGHMDTWTHGHMDTWTHGHMDTWTHGHMDTWTHGHMDAWTHGHMDTWTHGYMDTWIHVNLKIKIDINWYHVRQIFILGFGSVILLWLSCLHLRNQVEYVTFDTNLKLYSKISILKSSQCFWMFLLLIMLGLLISECPRDQIVRFIIRSNPNLAAVFCLALKFSRIISWTLFGTMSIYLFSAAVTPAVHLICLMVFQICCSLCKKMYHIGCLLYSLYCRMIFIRTLVPNFIKIN